MGTVGRDVSVAFAGGCFGALINSWVVYYAGRHGIPHSLGVAIAPMWNAPFLYRRIVWGGLWGFLFLVPVMRQGFWVGIFSRGILFSLAPTLFQLLYVFPFLAGKGLFGVHLGALTPLFVFIYNAVWGLCAAAWVRFSQ